MKLSVDSLSNVRIGDLVRPQEGQDYAWLPMTYGEDTPLHFKTVKGKVVSYDKETGVLCVLFSNDSFVQGLHGANDLVFQHVQSIRSGVYGKEVTEEELYQIYRPFIIDRHAYFYTWNTTLVKKDGSLDEENRLDPECLVDAEVKCSFTIRGTVLQANIFGCALEIDYLCVLKKPTVKPQEQPKPPAAALDATFSDEEQEAEPEPEPEPEVSPCVFQGVVSNPGPKELFPVRK